MAILPSVLSHWANRVETAKFGETEKEISTGCEQTGLSRATFLRQIKPYRPKSNRKVRSDKGENQLGLEELKLISSAWLYTRRKNGKTMMTLERILTVLRANNKVRAEFVDKKTGEVRPYSMSSIDRALRNANLHPDQLLRPALWCSCKADTRTTCGKSTRLCAYLLLKGNWQRQWVVHYGRRRVLQKQACQCGKSGTATGVAVCDYRPYVRRDLCGICVRWRNRRKREPMFINAIQPKASKSEPFYGVPKS
ncbi:Uncharacterised protein [Actinobacillus equuli]|nr:Uncharacterised protein [Actinobacillus equuli]